MRVVREEAVGGNHFETQETSGGVSKQTLTDLHYNREERCFDFQWIQTQRQACMPSNIQYHKKLCC